MLELNTAQTVSFVVRRVASRGTGTERARSPAEFAVSGQQQVTTFLTTHATLSAQFAEPIGLPDEVCLAIRQGYGQWDGKGQPQKLHGE